MNFTDRGAQGRAKQLRGDGTYVEGRYFGMRADLAAHYAKSLALEYGRDVQIVERVVFVASTFDRIRGRDFGRKAPFVTVLATITGEGSVFT